MSKVDLTPAKLAELKKDAGNYKYAFVTHPATVIAMVDEIEFLRRDNMVKAELLGKAMLKVRESEAGQ